MFFCYEITPQFQKKCYYQDFFKFLYCQDLWNFAVRDFFYLKNYQDSAMLFFL